MYPVPAVSDLASYSGRPEASYTAYADEALLEATLLFTVRTEISDAAGITDADQQVLAFKGILALADWLYLRQPYQALVAAPMQTESLGSYSYNKAEGMLARQFQGMELGMESTGVLLFDLAVQMLAKRTTAGGVYHDGITVFEEGGRVDRTGLFVEDATGRRWILGPSDRDQIDVPWDVNAMEFPHDPGV